MKKTSLRISEVVTRCKSHFAAADAAKNLAIEINSFGNHSPASRIAGALTADRLRKTAPAAVASIRANLKNAIRREKTELKTIESDAMRALELAAFIRGKINELPDALDTQLKAAAIALRGQPEGTLAARQLELAAESAHTELKRLNGNFWAKTSAAVSVVHAKSALEIYQSAGLKSEAAAAERLLVRARCESDAVRRKVASQRIGGSR
jgi:hypothetical protein